MFKIERKSNYRDGELKEVSIYGLTYRGGQLIEVVNLKGKSSKDVRLKEVVSF